MSNGLKKILMVLLICILLGACKGRNPELIAAEIDDHLSQLAQAGSFSGSVLVAKDGDILLQRGYGFADRENGVLNTTETSFRVHWLTMPVTAIAISMLQADGKLDVNDNICQFIPDCPSYWQEITIHHLLTHTSGLSERIKTWTEEPETSLELVNLLMHEQPYFKPGDKFRYSNNGYLVLGHILEDASGIGYEEFLRMNIYRPLGMGHSGLTDGYIAIGYNEFGAALPPPDLVFRYSASGLFSSVEDLYLLDQALYENKLLPPAEKTQMFTGYAQTPSVDLDEAEYGYGWFVGKILDRPVIAHGGMMAGYTAMLLRFPNERVTIIVLRNVELKVYDRLGIELARIVFDE
jgi:CubicO group peptidase (beta-lactamase class C family)